MIRYITFLVLQLKNCLGCGKFIGYLSLRVVLSNKGRITHAAAAFDWTSKVL